VRIGRTKEMTPTSLDPW